MKAEFWQKPGTQEWWLIAFLWGLPEEWRTWTLSSRARLRRVGDAAIFILPISAESLQGTKQRHLVKARAITPSPAPLHPGGLSPMGQVHLVISTTGPSPRRPARTPPVHQVYCKASALGEIRSSFLYAHILMLSTSSPLAGSITLIAICTKLPFLVFKRI